MRPSQPAPANYSSKISPKEPSWSKLIECSLFHQKVLLLLKKSSRRVMFCYQA